MLRKLEGWLAVAATVLAVILHVSFAVHAGGLWRDEVGVVNLAAMPTLPNVWNNLYYDSFPVLWPVVMRVWMALGLAGDGELRVLGLIIGLMILGALWSNARAFGIRMPLFSVLLLGLSPAVLVWCDSLRAWGLGVFWILMVMGWVWRVTISPTPWNVAVAALCALCAVQSTYYNSVLLFGICVAGMAVAGMRHQWRRCLLIAGIGAVAAASLIPYLWILRLGEDHYLILRADEFSFGTFFQKVVEALSFGGVIGAWVWAVVFALAMVFGMKALLDRQVTSTFPGTTQRELMLYSVVALAVGIAGYFLFLHHLRFFTRAWYYVALMAIAAVALDAMLSVLNLNRDGQRVRVGLAVLVLLCVILPAWNSVGTRMTNLDLIAAQLNKTAAEKDLVVINPWYCAIGFSRYYTGAAPWTGLPDMKDYRVHRYDVMREMMMNPSQTNVTAEVLGRMEATLKSGHRVWLVGGAAFLATGEKPLALPGAPHGPSKWLADPYYRLWSEQTAMLVQTHSMHFDWVTIPGSEQVNGLEYLPLIRVEGWRE